MAYSTDLLEFAQQFVSTPLYLTRANNCPHEYHPISKYTSIKKDQSESERPISLLVDEHMTRGIRQTDFTTVPSLRNALKSYALPLCLSWVDYHGTQQCFTLFCQYTVSQAVSELAIQLRLRLLLRVLLRMYYTSKPSRSRSRSRSCSRQFWTRPLS